MTDAITFTLDGREVEARPGETIWQVAAARGHRHPASVLAARARLPGRRQLPRLHGRDRGRARAGGVLHPQADGRHEGRHRLGARQDRAAAWSWSCCSPTSPRARSRTIRTPSSGNGRIGWTCASRAFPSARSPAPDLSHPAMAVNLDACIHCNLCVRACREVQVNDVIGMAYRNAGAKIVFDMDDPMGASTCVACGECVQACPTGALMPSSIVDEQGVGHPEVDRRVESVCPYCGVGCQITYHVKDDRIRYVTGRNGPANENRLCVKGRFGFDYIHHPRPADEAADPQGRRAEGGRRRDRSGQSPDPLPRGELGGGARGSPRAACVRSAIAMAAARSPASARPRARTRRRTCSRSWCAPASAPTTSTTARACATPPRSRRCSRTSARAR